MLHWAAYSPTPSSNFGNNNANGGSGKVVPQRYDSLNATQRKSTVGTSVLPLFVTIEEELHDARRVHAHGQEDDLRSALKMVIDRVSELSTKLQDAVKSQAELETQLGIAKANLQMVIANNDMLEDALKRDHGPRSDVGWNRGSKRTQSADDFSSPSASSSNAADSPVTPASGATSPTIVTDPPSPPSQPQQPQHQQQDSRFFRFRFNGSASSTSSRPGTPPASMTPLTPVTRGLGVQPHMSMPFLPLVTPDPEKEKEIADLLTKLQTEKEAHKSACDAKAALEAEVESLTADLFEEANKMVAAECKKHQMTKDELEEARLEKEALKSALRPIEGENTHLRSQSGSGGQDQSQSDDTLFSERSSGKSTLVRKRSSSITGVKSPPTRQRSLSAGSAPPSADGKDVNEEEASTSTPCAAHPALPSEQYSSLAPSAPSSSIPPSLTDMLPLPTKQPISIPSEDSSSSIPSSLSSFSSVELSPSPDADSRRTEMPEGNPSSDENASHLRPPTHIVPPPEAEASPW